MKIRKFRFERYETLEPGLTILQDVKLTLLHRMTWLFATIHG